MIKVSFYYYQVPSLFGSRSPGMYTCLALNMDNESFEQTDCIFTLTLQVCHDQLSAESLYTVAANKHGIRIRLMFGKIIH